MSPTVQTLLMGCVLLLVLVTAGRLLGGARGVCRATIGFYPLWLVYCAWHMSVGMSHGYSFMSELPFFAINFVIPALAAVLACKTWGVR